MIVNTRNEFISYLQTKFSQEVERMSESKRFIFHSDEFYLIREMSEVIDFFANSRYNYVDDTMTPTYSNTCSFDTDDIDRIIDFYKARYKLDNLPYIDYPKRTTNIVHDIFCGGGIGLPGGGGVDFFLTKDETGRLVWKKINTYLYKQFFVYQSGSYSFKLNIIPDQIYQVFINGQLIGPQDYELNVDTVTILPPNQLSPGAEIKIFAGYRTLVLSEIGMGFNSVLNSNGEEQFNSTNITSLIFEGSSGINITFDGIANKVIISAGPTLIDILLYEEEFLWAGVNNQFSLLNPAVGIFMIFINGQKISSQDFTHISGTNIVTLSDTLESDDEIDIIYKRIIE